VLFLGVNVQTGEEVAVKLVSLNIWLLPFENSVMCKNSFLITKTLVFFFVGTCES